MTDRKPPRGPRTDRKPWELYPQFDDLPPAQRLIEEAAAALEADLSEEWERLLAARQPYVIEITVGSPRRPRPPRRKR
jgi:hypothetical protein